MLRRTRLPSGPILFLLLLSAATGARAQTTQATGTVNLIHPATVQKIDDLEFGGIAVNAAGTIVIDPNSGAVSTTGGLVRTDNIAHAASFLGAARKQTVVNIRIPKQPITLVRSGGTETLTVSTWTLQGQDKRVLAAQSTFTFRVGATLTVPANAVEGTYAGQFTVEVQYP